MSAPGSEKPSLEGRVAFEAPAPDGAAAHAVRLPRRDELEAATVGMIGTAPRHKADFRIVDLGQGRMVVKDFAGKPWYCRLYGLVSILYERRAYAHLGHMPGIPVFLGRIDRHASATELIEGEWLTASPERFLQRSRHFAELRDIMNRLAAKGFLHLDIRNRRNVMIRTDGRLVVLDLEGSVWMRPGAPGYAVFEKIVRVSYRAALLKWRTLLTPGRSVQEKKTFKWRRGFRDFIRAARRRGGR